MSTSTSRPNALKSQLATNGNPLSTEPRPNAEDMTGICRIGKDRDRDPRYAPNRVRDFADVLVGYVVA
jgi:hypothetical protein